MAISRIESISLSFSCCIDVGIYTATLNNTIQVIIRLTMPDNIQLLAIQFLHIFTASKIGINLNGQGEQACNIAEDHN